MRVLSAADLLHVWEAARAQGPVRRALALLAAALPEQSIDRLADLSIGERDGLLLTLRAQIFGPRLASLATCPACGEQVELAFDTDDIRQRGEPIDAGGAALAGYQVRYRLPTSRDLLSIAESADLATARALLLRRCLLDGAPALQQAIDPALESALVAEIARRDPQADIRLALVCPTCGHAWEALFDIVGFLWSELERWAARMLQEIHLLASAYGWREDDILALSPVRRRIYLDLVSR
jgi:hypothetical protein